MNKSQYSFIMGYICLLFQILIFIIPNNYKLNFLISWSFVLIYLSLILIFSKDIYKGIKNRDIANNIYWIGIIIYLIGYILFAINYKKYLLSGNILFIIGSLCIIYPIFNIDLEKYKKINNIFTNKLLYKFWGGVYFLIGTICILYSVYKSSHLFSKLGMVFYIIGRIYFLEETPASFDNLMT